MPLRDAHTGLSPVTKLNDSEVMSRLRSLLPDLYFVNTPISRMRRHVALLDSLTEERIILDFHRPPGAQYTELVICSYDDTEPGLLSKVAGTLVALKINVHTAWIHTLEVTQPGQGGRQVVLDTLILSEPYFRRSRPLGPRSQAKIGEKMRSVLDGGTTVTELMLRQSRRPYPPLLVHELTAQPAPGPWTLIKLRAADDNGVLFRVTRALASLGLHIAHAQINTFEKEVDDVFFVRGAHGPLSTEEAEVLVGRLKAGLQNDALLQNALE